MRERRVPDSGTNAAVGRVAIVPALGRDWLTALYDPVVRFTTRERRFKARLLDQLDLRDGQRILDLACGTGTFAAMVADAAPGVQVVGLDADAKILGIARRKIGRATSAIRLTRALSFELPFPDGRFDRVGCSLFFHHLTTEDKRRTLGEIVRVLRPGGQLHVADWSRPSDPAMRVLSLSIRLLDGFETTEANFEGRLPGLLIDSGLVDVTERGRYRTVYGSLALLSGRKP